MSFNILTFVETGHMTAIANFKEHVLRINKHEPTESFALEYLNDSEKFLQDVFAFKNLEKQIA